MIALLLSVFLAAAPGAWIAFTLAGATTPFSARLGLAIALSPFVVGVQIWALTAAGLGFGVASAMAVLLGAPGAYLLWRGRPRGAVSLAWLAPALCFLAVAGGLTALWLSSPGLRIYSWHNMMQAEAVYQVARLPALPEEMGLAGVRMNYAWFGHIQIAAIGRLADASPFAVFPIINVATLLAFYLLMVDVVRRFIGDRIVIASAVTLAAILSPNLAGILLDYLGVSGGAGDIRLSTPLHKFLHFDLMTSGLALFAATMLLSLLAIEQWSLRLSALVLACLSAIGVIYPVMFPAAFVLAGAVLAARPISVWWSGGGVRLMRSDVLAAAMLAAPLVVWFAYLRVIGDGGAASVPVVFAAPWEVRLKLLDAVPRALGLWLPFLAFAAWRVRKTRDAGRLALCAAAVVLGVMYLVLELPVAVQYKFLVAALLCLTPLVAEQAIVWFDRLGPKAPAVAGGLAIVALLVVAPHVASRHVPWPLLRHAEPVDERRFNVAALATSDFAWANVVREQTPLDAVLVYPPMLAPVEVLTQRASYAALGRGEEERPGYSMPPRDILAAVKGHPLDLIARRETMLRTIYGDGPVVDYAALTAEFESLRRAVVLYLPHGNVYLRWLESNGVGHEAAADGDGVIWVIDVE